MQFLILFVVLVASPIGIHASEDYQASSVAANPIRKVVSMLQMMKQKVIAEGEKEEALYDKFMCYCKTGSGDLSKSIDDANTKVPQIASDIEAAESKKAQLDEDVKAHQADRAAAKEAMQTAKALREKEASEFAKGKSEADANIDALNKAVAAISSGMAGGFLQTGTAKVIQQLVTSKQDMPDFDRQELLSFLSSAQGQGYIPQSGEIVGILKQIKDEMFGDRAAAMDAEAAAIKAFTALMAAKKKEVAAATSAIETKLQRSGELAVAIATMRNDLTDTQEALIENKKFLADLAANCEAKKAEWAERTKTRADELVALAETIKVLNDDDALELFKKTLPSASASFVQMGVTRSVQRARALAAIEPLRRSAKFGREQLDFIALAIQGKKIGFEKVIKMIDEMVETLKAEQTSDDNKKEYCGTQLDATDDKKKELERAVADLETSIAETEEGIAALKDETAALVEGIKELDKMVAEATEQRKAEHEDFTELVASDSAAKEVIGFAINRLNKFYNPKLYVAPPKRSLSEEERITVGMGGTLAPTAAPAGIAGTGITEFLQVSAARQQHKEAPGPAPETFGAYAKKSEESTGVIQMMKLLIADLDKELTEATAEEENSQKTYEEMMKNSAEKRAGDSKALTEKNAAAADMEAALQAHTAEKASTSKELGATLKYIQSLHSECDWLVQYFDVRKEARASEIDALGKAKAVLSGADYALFQVQRNILRHN